MKLFQVLAISAILALVFVGATSLSTNAANPAVDLDQCANGGVGPPLQQVPCAGSGWVNGNLNGSKAHYREGESIPYRARLSNLTPGTPYTLIIQWDTTK